MGVVGLLVFACADDVMRYDGAWPVRYGVVLPGMLRHLAFPIITTIAIE